MHHAPNGPDMRRSDVRQRSSITVVIARLTGGVALLAIAGFTASMGLLALCGRSGREASPMALCPYDPGTAAVFLALAGTALGLGAWSISMTRRRGRLPLFMFAGLLIAGVAAAMS